MSIQVHCPQCNASHQVHDRMAGRHVRCPKCDTTVDVPAKSIATVDSTVDDDADSVMPVGGGLDDDFGAELGVADTDLSRPIGVDRDALGGSPVLTLPATFAAPSVTTAGPPTASDEDEDEEPVLARNKRPEEEMDMTPMVDVTFLLLIFFMVTAAFSLQKSIEMPRQQTDAPSTSVVEEESEDKDMVEVQVDEYGSFLVMAPDWERETPGKQNLISTLKEAAGNNSDGMRLVIKVHEMAKLSALVDCMDAGTIAGYAQLEVTQVEEFD